MPPPDATLIPSDSDMHGGAFVGTLLSSSLPALSVPNAGALGSHVVSWTSGQRELEERDKNEKGVLVKGARFFLVTVRVGLPMNFGRCLVCQETEALGLGSG